MLNPNPLPGVWSSPEVKGERPLPSSGFSLTSTEHAVLFGGQQPDICMVNVYVYVFDFRNMVSW